jgi:hypothetical protein
LLTETLKYHKVTPLSLLKTGERERRHSQTRGVIGRARRTSFWLNRSRRCAFDYAGFRQASPEAGVEMRAQSGRRSAEKPRHQWLLRARSERPRNGSAAERG